MVGQRLLVLSSHAAEWKKLPSQAALASERPWVLGGPVLKVSAADDQ